MIKLDETDRDQNEQWTEADGRTHGVPDILQKDVGIGEDGVMLFFFLCESL